MKKIGLIASVLVIAFGCNKHEDYSVKGPKRLTASIEESSMQTKTAIDSPVLPSAGTTSGLTISWKEGDEIAIYDGTTHKFTTDYAGKKVSISSTDELATTGTYYGMYPYDKFLGMSGTSMQSTILVNQSISGSDNWDPKAPVLVGSCPAEPEDQTIQFVNAHALVELNLPAAASNVTIDAGTDLSGDITVTANASSVSERGNNARYVSLAGNLTANKPYYVTTIPKSAAADVKIFVQYTGTGGNITQTGLHYYNLTQNIAFPKNEITYMNLANVTPTHLGGAVSDFKPAGTYLFVGPDGSCLWVKGKNGNDFKFEDLHATIYWSDTGTNDPTIVRSAAGTTHTMDISVTDGVTNAVLSIPSPVDSNGQTHEGTYYLAYASNYNGAFYCVSSREEATRFAGYYISRSTDF